MYKIKIFTTILILSTIFSCGQKHVKTPTYSENMFDSFISKDKFIADTTIFYPGLSNEKLRPILTELINESAEYFQKIAYKGNATENEYQNAIKRGLIRFSTIYLELDTEDRERICTYYEELMDFVGLESSGGHLNNFMYGFDFSK